MTADQAAELIDNLPGELRQAELASVLGVSLGHVGKMRGLNRVPKESFSVKNGQSPVWRPSDIREWLIERLTSRDADLEAARKAANKTRAMLGHHRPKQLALSPLYPFLGIY